MHRHVYVANYLCTVRYVSISYNNNNYGCFCFSHRLYTITKILGPKKSKKLQWQEEQEQLILSNNNNL